jgi:hypothetical protein
LESRVKTIGIDHTTSSKIYKRGGRHGGNHDRERTAQALAVVNEDETLRHQEVDGVTKVFHVEVSGYMVRKMRTGIRAICNDWGLSDIVASVVKDASGQKWNIRIPGLAVAYPNRASQIPVQYRIAGEGHVGGERNRAFKQMFRTRRSHVQRTVTLAAVSPAGKPDELRFILLEREANRADMVAGRSP